MIPLPRGARSVPRIGYFILTQKPRLVKRMRDVCEMVCGTLEVAHKVDEHAAGRGFASALVEPADVVVYDRAAVGVDLVFDRFFSNTSRVFS